MATDEEVAEHLSKAVKRRRKEMLKILKREKRLRVIALALPSLENENNFSLSDLAQILHAWYFFFFLFCL